MVELLHNIFKIADIDMEIASQIRRTWVLLKAEGNFSLTAKKM